MGCVGLEFESRRSHSNSVRIPVAGYARPAGSVLRKSGRVTLRVRTCRRGERRHQRLGEHDPENFGLHPLGETDPDHDDPLFDDAVPDTYERTITVEPLPHEDANGLVDLLATTSVSPGKIAVTTSSSLVTDGGKERAVTIGPLPQRTFRKSSSNSPGRASATTQSPLPACRRSRPMSEDSSREGTVRPRDRIVSAGTPVAAR